jgi:glyoxylase-like metal-dependent hydrolase (beta-lactamase superfamily II)
VPGEIDFRRVALDDGPFGAFAASRRLTPDGRVLLVSTPGHTRGHTSVLAIDDDGRHVLLAGDTTDTLEQLHARRADPITPDPDLQVQTIDRILAHAAEYPTIYLPTHDPEAVTRLHAGTTL